MIKKIILILVIIAILAVGAYFLVSINSVVNYSAQAFYIEKGDGVKDIAAKLQDRGIIKSKNSFYVYAGISGKGSKFIPGNHALPAGLSIVGVTDKLINIDNINKERQITILEGWSLNDIAKYFDEQGIASSSDFLAAADIGLWRGKYDFLNDKKIKSLEGFLFPDTYRVFIGSSVDKIIAKMLDNFDAKVTQQMRDDASAKNLSLYQAIIMASIIEQEAKYSTDKKMVADVFWKRIKIGMALQSDATINYLTNSGKTRSSGSDLQIDSPYNTYKYRGLPPGPISNPGIDSIAAAIYPQANDYLYFITDSSGRAVFAKTFEEHKTNIAKHLD